MAKKIADIGMRQLYRICNMSYEKRLSFLGEGLPILFESAMDCYTSTEALKDHKRSRAILMGQAGEEAAKILILIDAIRCPKKRISHEAKKLASWFYSHLVRLAYNDVLSYRPDTIERLKTYIKPSLTSHSLEGHIGEYILPNWEIFMRESRLYADAFVQDADEDPEWMSPLEESRNRYSSKPDTLILCESFYRLGLLSVAGAKIMAEVWGEYDFTDPLGYPEANTCIVKTLNLAQERNLFKPNACQDDVQMLHDRWQWPMYDFDLTPINLTLDELQEQQRVNLAFEMGYYD